MDQITATYFIETAYPLAQAAAIMAGEQSCGTFVRTPGESDDLRQRHLARVVSIEKMGTVNHPTLPGAETVPGRVIHHAHLTLAWPLENIGVNLPALVSTVAGNLFELAPFSGLKLLDIDLPQEYQSKYPGPRFGIEGTRDTLGKQHQPLIGTIIKPSVGLSPEDTANQVRTLFEAGLDFIKDDELQADAPHCPLAQRIKLVMEVINSLSDRLGHKPMYAFNITGDIDHMKRSHDLIVNEGGSCIMININWVGLGAAIELFKYSELPIHGHRCGWGLFSRSPVLGIGFAAYQKIWRLVGIDHIHTNGIRNKFCEDDATVIESIKCCLQEFLGTKRPMPVLSSGQWAGQVPDTYEAIQSTDVMYLCGGGIAAHPGGMKAGVLSIKQAWDAAVNGIPLREHAIRHRELNEAMEFFQA